MVVFIVFPKSSRSSGVRNGIAVQVLHAADIPGIRKFKGICQLKCSGIFIHQIFVIIGSIAFCSGSFCQSKGAPVKIRPGGAVANVIIEHIQIILAVRKGRIVHIGDGMLAALNGKIAFFTKHLVFILCICPYGFFCYDISHCRTVIDMVDLDDRGRLPGT